MQTHHISPTGRPARHPLHRMQADGTLAADDVVPESVSPPPRRELPPLALVIVVATLLTAGAVNLATDARLDARLRTSMDKAGQLLTGWQASVKRGLQVSLRAVADGSEATPAAPPATRNAFVPVQADAPPPVEPHRPAVAPRQLQPTR